MTGALLAAIEIARLREESIALLRDHEPPEGYYGAWSGGKDSLLMMQLAKEAGVRVEWHYHVTTVDPPPLVQWIRRVHPEVIWDRPTHGSMIRRAAYARGLPTKTARWCCQEYKHRTPAGRTVLLGIRAEESATRRARWRAVGPHFAGHGVTAVLPILEWSSDDLWSYVRAEGIAYPSLYDNGWRRLGCVRCPLASQAERERGFVAWPRLEARWRWAATTYWSRRHGTTQRDGRPWFGDRIAEDAEGFWRWWRDNR